MKRLAQPIEVCARGSRPVSFRWRGQEYAVLDVLDAWRVRAHWWTREEQRSYFQVLARPACPPEAAPEGVYELCQQGDAWRLERLLD